MFLQCETPEEQKTNKTKTIKPQSQEVFSNVRETSLEKKKKTQMVILILDNLDQSLQAILISQTKKKKNQN